MNRRGFLGSLLGTCAALVVAPRLILPESDFLALPETAEWQRVNTAIPWRMTWKDAMTGKWLQGPALYDLQATDTKEGRLISMKAEPIVAGRSLYVHPIAIRLINEQVDWTVGLALPTNRVLPLDSGDTLTFSNLQFIAR